MASNNFIQIKLNVYKMNSFSNQLIIINILQEHKAHINKPPPSLSLFFLPLITYSYKTLFENEVKYDLSHFKNGQK
jgi:hypothetical protein